MNLRGLMMAGAFVLLGVGCIPVSLNPIYTEKDLVYEEGLVGTWKGEDDDPEKISFEYLGDKVYAMRFHDGDLVAEFEARLLRIKNHTFMDLIPRKVNLDSELLVYHLIPVHSFWRVELDGDAFSMTTMDSDWLTERLEQGRLRVRHETMNSWLYEGSLKNGFTPVHGYDQQEEEWPLFTASTKRMQRFLAKWADDPKVFTDTAKFTRE